MTATVRLEINSEQRERLAEFERWLETEPSAQLCLVAAGKIVGAPTVVTDIVREATRLLHSNAGIDLTPVDQLVTVAEAGARLGIGETTVRRLLASGKIAFDGPVTEPVIKLSAVADYEHRRETRLAAVDRLAAVSDELGLSDVEFKFSDFCRFAPQPEPSVE